MLAYLYEHNNTEPSIALPIWRVPFYALKTRNTTNLEVSERKKSHPINICTYIATDMRKVREFCYEDPTHVAYKFMFNFNALDHFSSPCVHTNN